jgi:putative chitinase
LTYDELRRLCPKGNKNILKGIVAHAALLEKHGIAHNELRLCHFLAQAAHETAGFRTLVEFGSRRYFRRRYGHRRDLGNRKASDGWQYRGRGIFQLTGRKNYQRYGRFLNIDLIEKPQLAQNTEISLRIACEYWQRHNLNIQADRNDIRTITRRINGGLNGLGDRQRYFRRALAIWSSGAEVPHHDALLRAGDRGPDVWRLQRHLREVGYKIAVDGLFGRQTRKIVKAFQKTHHLNPDGIYGPLSKQELRLALGKFSKQPSTKIKEKRMLTWKSYFKSRTIWANLIGFAALALDISGFNGISVDDQSQLVDQLLKLVEAGGFIAGVVFRAIARDRLGPISF